MNMQIKFLYFLFFFSSFIFSQTLRKVKKLDQKLNEISGLSYLNDTNLIAINDGGNLAKLYVLNLKGDIVHELEIENAINVDWEDIAIDSKGNIYIADIGNNNNKRRDLCIYKISADSIFLKTKVFAQKIFFSYPEQNEFPPDNQNLNFDAEALAAYQDELYLFTKCRTVPYSGESIVYKLPTKEGNYMAEKLMSIQLKSRRMKFDAVTAVDFKSDTCYVLTYSGIEIILFSDNKFKKLNRISFKNLTQKEALCVIDNHIYIADEKYKTLFDAKLYKIKLK
jgi:hypothetical protein